MSKLDSLKRKIIELCNKRDCTCFFDRFHKWDWSSCCVAHDSDYINRAYHFKSKWQIDKELYQCVSKKTCKLFGAIVWLGNFTFSWIGWRMYKR